jgi:hypothetical protein
MFELISELINELNGIIHASIINTYTPYRVNRDPPL